jgi:hypothetical protein
MSYKKGAACASAVLWLMILAATAQGATTDFRGRFVCSDGQPLAGARVEFWQVHSRNLPQIWPNAVQRVAIHADANGAWAFRVTGGESNWFIRSVLVSSEVGVKDFPLTWNHFVDTLRSQNDRPVHDYGTQQVPGAQCRLWRAFQQAAVDFAKDTGTGHPAGAITVTSGAPNAGTPLSPYTDIWWPSDYKPYDTNGKSVAKHEYAHTVRHALDGNRAHFLGDAAYYWYARKHSGTSCVPTNIGFAFNEGWAEYWADEVRMTPCPNASDYRIERNVAFELKRLQSACVNIGTRGRMVDVLRRHRVHALSEFITAMGCQAAPPQRPIKMTGKAKRPADLLLKLALARVRSGHSWLLELDRTIRSLRAQAARAAALAKRAAPCPKRAPCDVAIFRRINPFLVQGQLDAARAIRKRYSYLGSKAIQGRIAKLSDRIQIQRIWSRRTALQRILKRITSRSLLEARRSIGGTKGTAAAQARTELGKAQGALAHGTQPIMPNLSPLGPTDAKHVGPDSGGAAVTPVGGGATPTTPGTARPDLVITSIDSMTSTSLPSACTVTFTRRNAGTGGAGDSSTALRLTPAGQTPVEKVVAGAALAAGQSRRETAVFDGVSCDPGLLGVAITVTATADSASRVDESDETNNSLSRTFAATAAPPTGKPDLVVTSIDSLSYTAAPPAACTVTFTRRNAGTDRAGDSTTALQLTAPNQVPANQTAAAGPLAAGESRQETIVYPNLNCDPASLGTTVTATVTADSASAVDESDETNNALSRTFP